MLSIKYINAVTNQIIHERFNAFVVPYPNTITIIDEIKYIVYQVIDNVDVDIVYVYCITEFDFLLLQNKSNMEN